MSDAALPFLWELAKAAAEAVASVWAKREERRVEGRARPGVGGCGAGGGG